MLTVTIKLFLIFWKSTMPNLFYAQKEMSYQSLNISPAIVFDDDLTDTLGRALDLSYEHLVWKKL